MKGLNITKKISFEFYPPKTEEGLLNLDATAKQLAHVKPEYFSVTFGAGGSTLDGTYDTVARLQKNFDVCLTPHISCISTNKKTIAGLLDQYRALNINRLVALRGDKPSGFGAGRGELQYASDLVTFIREYSGDHFSIEVGAYPEFHPESENALQDLQNFKKKIDAGANAAITQYFYNIESYFRFMDAVEKIGINVPITPGILPIINYKQLARFSQICGAEIPRWLAKRLEVFANDQESMLRLAHEFVSDLCANLLANDAPGLHFYTLNKASASLAILKELRLHAQP